MIKVSATIVLLLFVCMSFVSACQVVEHTAASFESEVLSGTQLWIIEFMANWCGGCRMVAPWYKQAATILRDEIQFGAMDMDGPGRQYANRYGVEGLPHIFAFVPGLDKPVGMAGLGGADSIVNFARQHWAKLTPDQQRVHTQALANGNRRNYNTQQTPGFLASKFGHCALAILWSHNTSCCR
jgi:protein disulfide-isomerase A6